MLSRRLFTSSARVFRHLSPLQEYNRLVQLGQLKDDPYQRKIIGSLGSLHSDLMSYTRPVHQHKSFFSKLFHSKEPEVDYSTIPKGIYLYGDVGCGKTMLMDLFYSTIPAQLTKKRLHFHQFMQAIHKRNHELVVKHGDIDTIPMLVEETVRDATVLCFDEFQVTDVADAMILRRVMEGLLARGVVLFATSNRAPEELYINGIQRASFVPCIKLIEQRTEVVFLKSPTDYRKVTKPISSVYWTPKPGKKFTDKSSRASAAEHVAHWFGFFAQQHPPEAVDLNVWGRQLHIDKCSPPNVAQFTFNELCGSPLAAGDYLTLASSFDAFIITDIPYLSVSRRDLIRRFITFLDAVYDHHGKIITTSPASFNDLFVEPEDMKNDFELFDTDDSLSVDEDDELVKLHGFDAKIVKHSKMFQLDEERFAFARALSRLSQMSTQEWVDFRH